MWPKPFVWQTFAIQVKAMYSSMKIQWLGKENCMDNFVSKWFTRWFTFLIIVVFMNRNSMWHHVSSCRKWIITQITFVIHLIFMAFMNCVKSLELSSFMKSTFLGIFSFVEMTFLLHFSSNQIQQVLDYCDDGIQKYFPIIKLPIIEVLFTDRETLFMS